MAKPYELNSNPYMFIIPLLLSEIMNIVTELIINETIKLFIKFIFNLDIKIEVIARGKNMYIINLLVIHPKNSDEKRLALYAMKHPPTILPIL